MSEQEDSTDKGEDIEDRSRNYVHQEVGIFVGK